MQAPASSPRRRVSTFNLRLWGSPAGAGCNIHQLWSAFLVCEFCIAHGLLTCHRHEDARVGPGVGVAKGKSKAKPKGTKPITATSAPSTSSSFASTSRSMSTTSATTAGAAEATKRKYAEPGAQKRAITVGRGRKAAREVDEDDELDDPFGDKENFDMAGEQAPPPAKKKKDRKGGIELLLAKKLDLADKAKKDPTGWWISEKCMSPPFRNFQTL